jgi:hypothetical protein
MHRYRALLKATNSSVPPGPFRNFLVLLYRTNNPLDPPPHLIQRWQALLAEVARQQKTINREELPAKIHHARSCALAYEGFVLDWWGLEQQWGEGEAEEVVRLFMRVQLEFLAWQKKMKPQMVVPIFPTIPKYKVGVFLKELA